MLRDEEVVVRGCVLMVLRCVVAVERVAVRAVVALLRRVPVVAELRVAVAVREAVAELLTAVALVRAVAVVVAVRVPVVRSTVRPLLLPPTMV